MAKELFKYSLHFPGKGDHKPEGRENGQQTPLVILFGWLGSVDRHVAMYSHIYSKKGYITLVVSLPGQDLFYHADKVPEIVQELFTILSDNRLTNNPVIAHVFSNGGSMIYSRFIAALRDASLPEPRGLQLRVIGVVFDSTPSKWSICMAVKAMMATVRSGLVTRYTLGLGIFISLTVFQLLPKVMLPLGIGNWYDLYDNVSHDRTRCPQLFLYSRADEIVPAADVAELVEARRRRGLQVEQVVWDESPHVRHFTMHPKVYTDTCRHFAHACLAAQL